MRCFFVLSFFCGFLATSGCERNSSKESTKPNLVPYVSTELNEFGLRLTQKKLIGTDYYSIFFYVKGEPWLRVVVHQAPSAIEVLTFFAPGQEEPVAYKVIDSSGQVVSGHRNDFIGAKEKEAQAGSGEKREVFFESETLNKKVTTVYLNSDLSSRQSNNDSFYYFDLYKSRIPLLTFRYSMNSEKVEEITVLKDYNASIHEIFVLDSNGIIQTKYNLNFEH